MERPNVAAYLERGAVQVTPRDGLARLLASRRRLIVKLGIDPTAPDIHLGFAVVLNKLRQFQDAGHTAVLIVGDFTAKIGDPSDRSKTRPSLSDAEIAMNARTFRAQVLRILRKDRLRLRRNSAWYGRFKAADFLRLFSRVTASQILARDDFAKRMAAGLPIGLHELLYPVLQGYDSVAVGADVEIGGTDQTFNLLMGRDVQQQFGATPQVVITLPLLVGLDGKQKMSKSLGNYIGITDAAEEMFGKVMSIPDALMEQYAAWGTDLTWSSLQQLQPMEAKKRIAFAIAQRYHGTRKAGAARRSFEERFQERRVFVRDADVRSVHGTPLLLDFLVQERIFSSKSEARRKMQEGAVRLNGKKVIDVAAVIQFTNKDETMPLRVGKKGFYTLRPR